MRHDLIVTSEKYMLSGIEYTVLTYEGNYKYNISEGDIIVIHDGTNVLTLVAGEVSGSNMCKHCPVKHLTEYCCRYAIRCKHTNLMRAVCRTRGGLKPIESVLEDL